jgi:hypothetical protein
LRGNQDLNPYETPTISPDSPATRERSSRFARRLATLLLLHLLAVVASAWVVRSGTILSDRYLELMIAAPLALSTFAFPLAITFFIVFTKQRSLPIGWLALAADLVLSTVQFFQWIPTVQ